MKKLLLLLVCAVLINGYSLMAQTKSETNSNSASVENKTPSIIYVLSRGKRSGIVKYLYKDLIKGMNPKGYRITIDFITPEKATAAIFEEYDVVIAVSERSSGTVSAPIQSFVSANNTEDNLLVLAFDRRGGRFSPIKGVDVISSASNEDQAARFVKNKVSQQVVNLLEK